MKSGSMLERPQRQELTADKLDRLRSLARLGGTIATKFGADGALSFDLPADVVAKLVQMLEVEVSTASTPDPGTRETGLMDLARLGQEFDAA